jgi:uncharacterized protein YunC (DUF1805 family)
METECASCEVRTGLSVQLQVASISQLTVSRLSRQCGILNISQLYRLPRPVTGIAYFKEKECASCEVRTGLKVLLQVASILQLTVSKLSRQCGILNISQPYRLPRPVTGIALLYGEGVCFLWGTNWTEVTATSSQYLAVNCEQIV